MSQLVFFAGVMAADAREHPSLMSPGLRFVISPFPCLLLQPVPLRVGPAFCLSGTVVLIGLMLFYISPGLVLYGEVAYPSFANREICTSFGGDSRLLSWAFCCFIPSSVSGAPAMFSVCFVSGRTELLTRSRSHASHHSFFWGRLIYLFSVLLRKRENNLFLHIYVF